MLTCHSMVILQWRRALALPFGSSTSLHHCRAIYRHAHRVLLYELVATGTQFKIAILGKYVVVFYMLYNWRLWPFDKL